MRSLLVTCSLVLLFMSGCNLLSSNKNGHVDNGNNSNNASGAKAKGDFSTPKAAVETFIKAGTNRDADLLSQCFHPDSPGEWRKYREKTLSAKQLDETATELRGAEVTDVKETGETAVVKVTFKERKEEISMKKSGSGWKILDF